MFELDLDGLSELFTLKQSHSCIEHAIHERDVSLRLICRAVGEHCAAIEQWNARLSLPSWDPNEDLDLPTLRLGTSEDAVLDLLLRVADPSLPGTDRFLRWGRRLSAALVVGCALWLMLPLWLVYSAISFHGEDSERPTLALMMFLTLVWVRTASSSAAQAQTAYDDWQWQRLQQRRFDRLVAGEIRCRSLFQTVTRHQHWLYRLHSSGGSARSIHRAATATLEHARRAREAMDEVAAVLLA